MRVREILPAVLMAIAMGTAPSFASDIANNPDFTTVFLLQDRYAHASPPYNAMAQWDRSVRTANEFRKSDAIKQAVAGLKARMASLQGVKEIVVNLMSNFADYDAQYHEYDFDINDGSYIPYTNGLGGEVRIALTNGTDAQAWQLSPEAAEAALRKNDGERGATLVLTLQLLPSSPAADGETPVLNAKIVKYDVLSDFHDAKLGSVVVGHIP